MHGARRINEQRDPAGDNLRIIRIKYCVCRIYLKRIIIVDFLYNTKTSFSEQ